MVNATEFTDLVEKLFVDDRFLQAIQQLIETTLKARNDALPVDDKIARAVYHHSLPEVIRAVAKAAQAHGQLHVAGKLRALLPGMKK